MDATGYIKRNKKQIERSSKDNWLENDIEDIIDILIVVIGKATEKREHKSETNLFFAVWFQALDYKHVGFYRQWLLRAFNDDMSFVYARNALIRSLNCDSGDGIETVPQINTTIWERYLSLRDSVNLSGLKEKICYNFPDLSDRLEFIAFSIFQLTKIISESGQFYSDKLKLIKELKTETLLEVEENSIIHNRKKVKPDDRQRVKYVIGLEYVDLFNAEDKEKEIYAEAVKEVLDDMRLTKDGKLILTYSPNISSELKSSTDRKKVGINVLAYVFAALKDPDNGIIFIKYGYDTPQLKIFYSEFGIKVTEHSPKNPPANSTVIRNLTKITSKGNFENRKLNNVYKDFRLRYKEKLKEHKLFL